MNRAEIEVVLNALRSEHSDFFTPYVESHVERYIETAGLLDRGFSGEILELGASWPWFFTRLLYRLFPDSKIELAENRDPADIGFHGSPPECWHRIPVSALSGKEGHESFRVRNFNIETEVWPYEDGSFDLVLCMELLEHLLVNPYWIFKEARRVLRPGGLFILTTPNVASLEGIQRIIDGNSPYIYGVYSPYGAYGRHNREYAPKDIDRLGVAAGFRTKILDTKNIYPRDYLSSGLLGKMKSLGLCPEFSNQGIFYCGIRDESMTPKGYPSFLYAWDPDADAVCFVGETESRHQKKSELMDLKLVVVNRGKHPVDPASHKIHGTWVGLDHWYVGHFYEDVLESVIASGERKSICLKQIRVPAVEGIYRLKIDFEKEGRGVLSSGASPIHQQFETLVVVS